MYALWKKHPVFVLCPCGTGNYTRWALSPDLMRTEKCLMFREAPQARLLGEAHEGTKMCPGQTGPAHGAMWHREGSSMPGRDLHERRLTGKRQHPSCETHQKHVGAEIAGGTMCCLKWKRRGSSASILKCACRGWFDLSYSTWCYFTYIYIYIFFPHLQHRNIHKCMASISQLNQHFYESVLMN